MRRSQNALIEVTAGDLRKIGWLGKNEAIQTVSTNEDGGISIVATIAEKAAKRAPRRAYKKRKQPASTKKTASTKKASVKNRVKKNAVSKQEPAPKKSAGTT